MIWQNPCTPAALSPVPVMSCPNFLEVFPPGAVSMSSWLGLSFALFIPFWLAQLHSECRFQVKKCDNNHFKDLQRIDMKYLIQSFKNTLVIPMCPVRHPWLRSDDAKLQDMSPYCSKVFHLILQVIIEMIYYLP